MPAFAVVNSEHKFASHLYNHTVIIICGPTAVGKTDFAFQLAGVLGTEIISADSRQCYKELNIGVAKPSLQQMIIVPHYFVNSHSIEDDVNAAVFEDYALKATEEIFSKHSIAVMVGGTGLYIKAFCEGLDEIPVVQPAVREKIAQDYKAYGINYLQKRLMHEDPEFWQLAEQQNPQRLMRALEVLLSTGRSIISFRKGSKAQRPFNIIKVGLELPRKELYTRINKRVDEMINHGLVEEVSELFQHRHLNALQTVGYQELFEYFEQKLSAEEAIEKIKQNTRHYAKRQITWFKKDPLIQWHNAEEFSVDDFLAMHVL